MKKTFLIIFLSCSLTWGAGAQGMPVYDNTSFIALAKSLIESAKQTSQLLKTVRFLKAQKERLEQVSSAVRQLQAVQEIVTNNQRLIMAVREDLDEILRSPYIRTAEIDQVSDSFNTIMQQALEDLDFMQQLLTSDLLKMSDSQRLTILEDQRKRSREMVAEVELRKRRYKTIISFRKMKSRINNRTPTR